MPLQEQNGVKTNCDSSCNKDISISTNILICSSVNPGTFLNSLDISSAEIPSLPVKSICSNAAHCSGVNSLTICIIASVSYPKSCITSESTSSML
ncbi:hypothetical protein ACHAXS_004331 [Conticribra weissflogii]